MDRADAQIYLEMTSGGADIDRYRDLRTYIRDRYSHENQTAELDASIDEQLDILRGIALRVRPRSQFGLSQLALRERATKQRRHEAHVKAPILGFNKKWKKYNPRSLDPSKQTTMKGLEDALWEKWADAMVAMLLQAPANFPRIAQRMEWPESRKEMRDLFGGHRWGTIRGMPTKLPGSWI